MLWVQHGFGDCTENSYVALTKSLRGKLPKLVSFLITKGRKRPEKTGPMALHASVPHL